MCAVSHFGTVVGILCAVTCIMPAGHRKTTQIKCEIEKRHNLKLASSRDAVWHMRVATYCKKIHPISPTRRPCFQLCRLLET